jgi:hypothetical protein
MKILKFVFLFVVYSILNASADPTQSIANQLNALRESYTESGEKGGDNLRLTADIQRAIQIYIRGADTNDWASPSTERLRRINQIGAVIEPHLSLLIDLGTPTANGDANSNALNLLSFAVPSSQLKKQLLALANAESSPGLTKRAYGLLVNHGMATPDVRQEIVKRMTNYQNSYKTPIAAEIYSGAKEWRIEEALPLYIELLQSEYRSKEELNWRFRSVAESVRGLGSKATAILPLLQQQLARMKAESADFRDINIIEGAIRAIEGKDPIEPLLAVSGAGPIVKNPQPTISSLTTAAQKTPMPPMETLVQQPKSEATPSIKIEVETPSSSSFPILPVAILAAVIVGIVIYILRRKSK